MVATVLKRSLDQSSKAQKSILKRCFYPMVCSLIAMSSSSNSGDVLVTVLTKSLVQSSKVQNIFKTSCLFINMSSSSYTRRYDCNSADKKVWMKVIFQNIF